MSTMRVGLLLVLLSGCTSTVSGHWRGGEAGMDGVAGAAGSDEAAGSANAGSGATVSRGGQAGQSATGGAGSQAGASTGGVAGSAAGGAPGCNIDGYDTSVVGAAKLSSHYSATNGHCYLVVNQGVAYDVAQTGCANWGGHLVTITAQAEQDFINSIASPLEQYSIGLVAPGPNQNFAWETGEALTYTSWATSQPDFMPGVGSPYCVETDAFGNWSDYACFYGDRSICEREQ